MRVGFKKDPCPVIPDELARQQFRSAPARLQLSGLCRWTTVVMLLLLNVLMAVSATSHLVPDTGILAEAGAALPSLIDHFLAERTSANEALYGRTSTGVNRLNFTANGTKAREQLFQEDGSANRAFINPRGKLRLPRLSAYLRHRVLDAAADFSILIFHLSNAEFQQALGGISPE